MKCVLVHAALADARMWEPVIPWFAGHEPVAYDLRGHGQMDDVDRPWHHVDDLLELLTPESAGSAPTDRGGGTPAVLVGSSMGGRVALEAAVLRPELVDGLVLLCPGLEEWDWSAESEAYGDEEERLLAAGDLDGATALNVRFWVVGHGRSAGDVPREVLRLVTAMQRRAFAIQAAAGSDESPRVDDLLARMPELRCPALVVVGEHDIPEMHEIAGELADTIPGAEHAVIPGTAHLPSLEAPERTGPLIARFLKAI